MIDHPNIKVVKTMIERRRKDVLASSARDLKLDFEQYHLVYNMIFDISNNVGDDLMYSTFVYTWLKEGSISVLHIILSYHAQYTRREHFEASKTLNNFIKSR